MKLRLPSIITAATVILCTPGFCADWGQYRGPEVDGISTEKIRGEFSGATPRLVWRVPAPAGFSSFVVAGGKAFTLVTRNVEGAAMEVCLALDAATGKELWATPVGLAKYPGGGDSGAPDNRGGDGPRSTPAAKGDRVWAYSADMALHCLDAGSGKPVWTRDIIKDFGGKNIQWKNAISPVLEGELVFVAGGGAGQAMLAFNQKTGEAVWKTGSDAMTHATPALATIHGTRQVIFMMQSGMVAVEIGTGKELWRYAFPYRTSTACSPVVAGDIVFCTAGYEVGGAACRISKTGSGFEAQELWRSKGNEPAASLWSPPVHKDGFLYGMISFKKFGRGPLKCLDVKTGDLKWEQPGFGAGQVMLAGDRIIAVTDAGEVVVVKASPEKYEEVARFKALDGKCWNSPGLANGRLYLRSTKEGACFDLSAAN